MRKASIAGGLEFGALGEIRTPYPLVRRQVGGIQFFLYSSTGYKASMTWLSVNFDFLM
jgi:hypothetical protein